MEFNVSGMSCAACSARVEKAVSAVDGVRECSVSLLTGSMHVDGDVPADKIIAAVQKAGYGASSKEAVSEIKGETNTLKNRLIASLALLILLMYVSMGYTMLGFPLPEFFAENPISIGLVQMLLCIGVAVINQRFFISGFKGAVHRAPNMDTLVSLGSASAFLYSVYVLISMAASPENAHMHLHDLYFETSAMILALITVGKMLESRAKGKTADALKSLMQLAPKTATVIKDGIEAVVLADEVQIDDVFVLRPGDRVPVDGTVIEGTSAVNESALTGESVPVDKQIGDKVSAATLNTSGFLKCRAERVGQDTTLSQIIKMVTDAQSTKAPIAKLADRVSGIFVPAVLAIAAAVFVIWLLINQNLGFAVARAVSVLVISCPCALGLATPVAIMVGSGVGARHGILFKNATALEQTGRADTVVLDKTGTVTKGSPAVTAVFPIAGYTEDDILSLAYAIENQSEHPLARAIAAKATEKNLPLFHAEDFVAVSGSGVSARVEFKGKKAIAYGANKAYTETVAAANVQLFEKAEELAAEGKTPMFFAFAGEIVGIIAVADEIKEDSREAIKKLKKLGIKTVMLTGDNRHTARAVAEQVGIAEVVSDVLPDGKLAEIERLKSEGKCVVMVGDGINDSPALVGADVGMAVGAGTDVAIESADVVLVKSGLTDVVNAVTVGRATLANIKENLFWAFFYNVIGIPIAAGALYPLGLLLNPMLGAAAMSLSSFCVVMNALRLNFIKLSQTNAPVAKETEKIKGEEIMETVMNIEGMMCPHCEGRVKKTLEAIDGVKEALVSHKDGTALIKHGKEIDFAVFRDAVQAQGYEVK